MGSDDRQIGPSDDGIEASIVKIAITSSAAIADLKVALLEIASSVQDWESDHVSATLMIEGATQHTIREHLTALDVNCTIVRRDVYEERAVLLLFKALRLALASAEGLSGLAEPMPPRKEECVDLLPRLRRTLVDALVSAFPTYSRLHLVFTRWIKTPLSIYGGAEAQLDVLYDSIIEIYQSHGRLDEFVCGATQQNPGNRALSALITTELRHCRSCERQRNPTSCPVIS